MTNAEVEQEVGVPHYLSRQAVWLALGGSELVWPDKDADSLPAVVAPHWARLEASQEAAALGGRGELCGQKRLGISDCNDYSMFAKFKVIWAYIARILYCILLYFRYSNAARATATRPTTSASALISTSAGTVQRTSTSGATQ